MHRSQRSPWESALVRNRRDPQTIGVEPPMPGRGKLQAMFSVVLQRAGRLVSVLMPSPRGPRHCGQLSARTKPASVDTRRVVLNNEQNKGEGVTVGLPQKRIVDANLGGRIYWAQGERGVSTPRSPGTTGGLTPPARQEQPGGSHPPLAYVCVNPSTVGRMALGLAPIGRHTLTRRKSSIAP